MKNSLFLVVLFVLSATFSFAQVTKVLISGIGNTATDNNVGTAFAAGYGSYDGSIFGGTVTTISDGVDNAAATFAFASSNGYEVVIRSTTGLASAVGTAGGYPGVMMFMPAGSNVYQSEYSGDVTTCPIVITGAGTTHNATAYSVEFFGVDPVSSNISAYSNGYVAGQMCFLANYGSTKHTTAQVRALARAYGKSTPLDADGFHDGYGQVNVATIIASAMPVELTSFVAKLAGNTVVLNWKTATETNNYGFEVERQVGSSSWSKIGFVAGAGNSNIPKEYSFVDKSAQSGTIEYRLKQIDRDGKFEYHKQIEVTLETAMNFDLAQNFPNPFNPSTEISFKLPSSGFVSLKIYDIQGREIATLLDEEMSAGVHRVKFDGSKLSSGNYIYKISAGSFTAVKRMVLLK